MNVRSLIDDSVELLDLLRKYPEDLQFPNEIRKPHPKKATGNSNGSQV